MIYLANASSERVRAAMTTGEIGMLCTPREGRAPPDGVTWAADNGCFGSGYPGDQRWLAWLRRHSPRVAGCLFATAPDVVGDAAATLARSVPLLASVRHLGYRVALVGQDGLEHLGVPWRRFDVLFIGGTTEWKLGAGARSLIAEALSRGIGVHMGRVNSGKRHAYAMDLGCHSVDGTFLAFGPDGNLARMRQWRGWTPAK